MEEFTKNKEHLVVVLEFWPALNIVPTTIERFSLSNITHVQH